MTDVQHEQQGEPNDPVEKLVLHLLRHPYDLVDTRRLMRRFRASAADMQRALRRIDQLMPQQTEEPMG